MGVSAALVPAGSYPTLALGLPVLVLMECLAHWVMSFGDVALMISTPAREVTWGPLVEGLDGLVLQGGADISPRSYGEEPVRSAWAGDSRRDAYELALLREFLRQGKPVLGICRGMQLLNVAFGGTLYQDIPEQFGQSVVHRDLEALPGAVHEVVFPSEGGLARLYPGRPGGRIVSVHHQAVKDLGQGLTVEALSREDGLIEAVRLERGRGWALGVQWHPEMQPVGDPHLLDPAPLLEEFLQAARAARLRAEPRRSA